MGRFGTFVEEVKLQHNFTKGSKEEKEVELDERKIEERCNCVIGDSNEWNIFKYSSLNIERLLYVLKRRHPSLDLNGPTVHTIYLS